MRQANLIDVETDGSMTEIPSERICRPGEPPSKTHRRAVWGAGKGPKCLAGAAGRDRARAGEPHGAAAKGAMTMAREGEKA